MSASERLAALDAAMTPGHWSAVTMERGFNREIADLRNALPEIVAVVRAAEKMRHDYQQDMNDWSTAEYDGKPWPGIGEDFDAALAALREKLTDAD